MIYIDLGQMCAMFGDDLRHEVLSNASIVIAQIRWRIIDKMRSTHWYYTWGDIAGKLEQLHAGTAPPIDDSIVTIIEQKLSSGRSRNELVRTLKLQSEASLTALVTEQFHARFAALSRYHPEYSQATLQSRCVTNTLAMLTPKLDEDEQRLQKLYAQLKRLSKKRSGKCTGKAMYVQSLMHVASDKIKCGRIGTAWGSVWLVLLLVSVFRGCFFVFSIFLAHIHKDTNAI